MLAKLSRIARYAAAAVGHPRDALAAARIAAGAAQGMAFERRLDFPTRAARPETAGEENPLRAYFDRHTSGPGIWKWRHYFDIYHQHFAKFVGRAPSVMEVGIYSGGSLGMWRSYFGDGCRIYGVDIEPACKVYRADGIDILIGDQSDRSFWSQVRRTVPQIDVFIDDGGHHPAHQIVTLEEMLPHMAPGGVYLCEDIHGAPNMFASYVAGLASRMHSGQLTPLIKHVAAIHTYPFVTAIDVAVQPLERLEAEKRGSQWQPFLDDR